MNGSIKNRQREGIEAAKAKGVKFGRRIIPLPEDFEDICERWRSGEITAAQAAEECGFSRTTFFNRVRELGKKQN